MVANKQLNIKIITTAPFPNGMAASNRIMSYAKGLKENNCIVSVYCLKPTENSKHVFNKSRQGIINGIYFEYLSGSTEIKNNSILNQLEKIKGVFNMSLRILREEKDSKSNAIIYYDLSTSPAFLLYLITRLKKILLLKEVSEFPKIYSENMHFLPRYIFNHVHYRLFDAFLIMTKRLIKYFKEENKYKTPYILVPMTVESQRFQKIEKISSRPEYIAYCGEINSLKDGVDILIDAFIELSNEFPEFSLILIGDVNYNQDYLQYVKKIDKHQLSDRIIFKGRISRDDVPKILCNAKMLVLARPANIQSECGFPTKLGEYLATGNPVIVTNVGEIPDYLTDGVNAFIAEAGSVNSLLNKMKLILQNYEKALEIGDSGKKIALKHFNYYTQAQQIIKFIQKLEKNKIN